MSQFSPFHLNYCKDCTSLRFTLPAPNTHTSSSPSAAAWRSKSHGNDLKWLKVHLKRCKCFFFCFFCLHDYAGNKGLRVTGYDNGKCEAWHEVRKTGLLSTIATIRLWPTKTKNTPLGGCWNNQTSLFIHTAKRHNTPAARDVISEWNYGH